MEAKRILVVDDEPDLLGVLTYNLEREGYTVETAATGAAAIARLRDGPTPDLLLLDLMLPDISGFDVCRQLRDDDRLARVPVLMLTAKGAEDDRIGGFQAGADDYVTKPFSVAELKLRVRALLRRSGPETPTSTLSFGDLHLDRTAHRVWVGDTEVRLTVLEFVLLSTLLERKGRVQSREMLLRDVWGIAAEVTTRTVDTHIKRLREKIEPAGAYIETVRGVGYRFCDHP